MSVTYMTRQQRAVLEGVKASPEGCATAAELTEQLHREGQTVGLTTVYRQLEKLVAQGKVHKLLTEEGACYQYCDKARHTDCFLLQCEGCGTIFHMDCSHLGELYQHLEREHHFRIDPRRTLFYGLCDACSKEETP